MVVSEMQCWRQRDFTVVECGVKGVSKMVDGLSDCRTA